MKTTNNNYARTKSARAALEAHLRSNKWQFTSHEEAIIDCVTDLLHLANRHDIDPATIVRSAYGHFEAEHGQRAEAARRHGRKIKHAPAPLYNQNGEQIREVTQDELDWTH